MLRDSSMPRDISMFRDNSLRPIAKAAPPCKPPLPALGARISGNIVEPHLEKLKGEDLRDATTVAWEWDDRWGGE